MIKDEIIKFNQELEEIMREASQINSMYRFNPELFFLWRLKNVNLD